LIFIKKITIFINPGYSSVDLEAVSLCRLSQYDTIRELYQISMLPITNND